jgi:uncharacterized LabA/DUF88 family protein
MNDKKIAIFFDCENISVNYIQDIFNELANIGEVIIRQSFKDWESQNNKSWNQEIHEEFAIEPIQVFTTKNGKNSSDLRLQRAVLETMNYKKIDTIAIVSSDNDFRDLAMNIRSNGFEAIGFGESKSPKSLQNAYSTFIELPIKTKIEDNKDSEIIALLKEAIINQKDENGFAYVAQIGSYLKNKNSSCNAKNYGANTWGDIIKKYTEYFEIDYGDKKKSQLLVKIKGLF